MSGRIAGLSNVQLIERVRELVRREWSRSVLSAIACSSPRIVRRMRSCRSCARSCAIRFPMVMSGRSWPGPSRACSSRSANKSLQRPPRPGPIDQRTRRCHDMFPPRSGAPSGSATLDDARTSRRPDGDAIRKSSWNSTTWRGGRTRTLIRLFHNAAVPRAQSATRPARLWRAAHGPVPANWIWIQS
jgi:hypothetical protein